MWQLSIDYLLYLGKKLSTSIRRILREKNLLTARSSLIIVLIMSRNIEFDRDEVIAKAKNLFWKNGFKNTSLSDLVEITGLHKGSLYGTFESKENLFILALQQYGDEVLNDRFTYQGSHKKFIENFFTRIVDEGESGENSIGCLVMTSCLEFSHSNRRPGKVAQQILDKGEQVFLSALKGAQKDKEIPSDLNADSVTKRLLGAAFAIRELSMFRKDRLLFAEIANGALAGTEITIG